MKFSMFILLITLPNALFGQAPDTVWTKTFGGIDDEVGYSVQQTTVADISLPELRFIPVRVVMLIYFSERTSWKATNS